ncbi:protein kinase C-binding protein 1-like isoform X2 [Amphibalanus amphitrite]|uniref:protein kinase C-binding protein 1-like isoform X2 n=1 Tax=Amphibalanus amphitrite TaxID=1232801 RepID=UPI001C91A24A|nr:protein kinase C-binding protein 1-like isoform X2 [Amphibalanus amphitrite]
MSANPEKDQSDAAKGSTETSESEASNVIQAKDAEAAPDAAATTTAEEAALAADASAPAVDEPAAEPAAEPASEPAPEQAAPPPEPPAETEAANSKKAPAEEVPVPAAAAAEQEATHEVEAEAEPATATLTGETTAEDTPAEAAAMTDAAASGAGGEKPRATRSRNPAFAAKQKNFIKDYKRSVGGAPAAGEKRGSGGSGDEAKKRRKSEEEASGPLASGASLNDNCCWVCHREGKVVCCETCPRVFHLKCAQLSADPPGDWVCVECRRVVQAETVDNLSPAMKMLTHEQFTLLLKHAIGRLKGLPGAEPFITPVDEEKFPNYSEFVACPMDLNTMEENIQRGQYGSTEAFIADCKWILHNCILFNGQTSKLTALAKSLLRMCKWEMEEIETCPDCYSNAYLSEDWFTLACPHPHMLIWARLKGFPYWPAKAVKSRDGNVDCRFFGRHDRAWVPIKECYLFSKDPPSPPKNRSKSLDACIEELEEHIHNLEEKFGKFVHAKPRTVYDPRKITEHIKQMLPNYECNIVRPDQEVAKRKRGGSDLQLDKLEKLRQQKKARRSGPPAGAAAAGKAGGDRAGPGAPGGPPELQAEGDEEMEQGEEEGMEENMEEMMEEVEEDEPMDEAAPTPTPKAAKPARKSQGKTPAAAPAAAASPAPKPAAATPAKAAAGTSAKAAAPAKGTASATPAAKAAASPAPAPAKAAAAQPATPATPAAGSKPAAKADTQPAAGAKAAQKAAPAAAVATPVKAVASPAVGTGQRLVKVNPTGPPPGGLTRPAILRAPQSRARASPVPVRTNGVDVAMSPAAAVRQQQLAQQSPQQRQQRGSPATPQGRSAVSQSQGRTQSQGRSVTIQTPARSVATSLSQEAGFIVYTPSRIGPMMIVPNSGGAVSNGPSAAGPAEGATAAQAPAPPTHTGAVGEQLRTQANDLSEMIRSCLDQSLTDLAQSGAAPAALASLRLQLERLQWRHQMELSEQKKVTDTMLAELRNSMEIEQKKTVNKLTTAFASERAEWSRLTELKVAETKKKQWCATCRQGGHLLLLLEHLLLRLPLSGGAVAQAHADVR